MFLKVRFCIYKRHVAIFLDIFEALDCHMQFPGVRHIEFNWFVCVYPVVLARVYSHSLRQRTGTSYNSKILETFLKR